MLLQKGEKKVTLNKMSLLRWSTCVLIYHWQLFSLKITTLSIQDDFGYYSLNLLSFTLQLFTSQLEIDKVLQELVTNRSSVLLFCPNQTEPANQSSVSRTKTEQNRTCIKCIKSLDLNCKTNKQTKILIQLGVKPRSNKPTNNFKLIIGVKPRFNK